MRCDEALELLCAAIDGEITPAQQAQLDQHLAQCPACRALQAELLGMEEALGSLEVPAPAGLKEQILDHLPPQTGKAKPVYWRRWCAMAACAALVVLGVWQLPRSVLRTDDKAPRSADTVDTALTAGTAAPADQENETALATATLNDEAALPPYVEGDGVDVNAAPTARVTDPSAYHDASYREADAPAETPDAPAPAPAPATVPTPDTRSAKIADAAQTSGEPVQGAASDQLPTETESAQDAPILLCSATPDGADSIEPPIPEATPELTMLTVPAGGASQDPDLPAQSVPEASAPPEAPNALMKAALSLPRPHYCGILTLAQYQPAGQDNPEEVLENGQRQYTLPAPDFHALVEQLDSQGSAYELTAEGEGIDPEVPWGLVVVTEQAETGSPETP